MFPCLHARSSSGRRRTKREREQAGECSTEVAERRDKTQQQQEEATRGEEDGTSSPTPLVQATAKKKDAARVRVSRLACLHMHPEAVYEEHLAGLLAPEKELHTTDLRLNSASSCFSSE